MADPPDPQLLLAGDPAAITGESEELRHEDLDLKSGNVKERGYHGDWKREAKNYRVLQENLDGFETLCVANGCNPADARSIEKLEVFMTNYPVMSGLERFVSVAHMEIQHQPIEEIRGLDAMPLLVELLINHTRVHRIQGLDKNLKLEKLSLDFNRITVLENLDHLRCLKTLSVSCNQIERIENLQGLSSLTHLNLAGNRIRSVDRTLEGLSTLRILNLAGNLISSFQEIHHLKRLEGLHDLYLSDPHYGENPVCRLWNYHTYSLCHLRRLQLLDAVKISPEAIRLAEATYRKKQLFYKVQIKTCQMVTNHILSLALDIYRSKQTKFNLALKPYIAIEKQSLYEQSLTDSTAITQSQLELKMNAENIEEILTIVHSLEKEYGGFKNKLIEENQRVTAGMLEELDNGGNFRLIEGTSEECWYSKCMDFVRGEIEKEKDSFVHVEIDGIAKIHNQLLSHRFEDALNSLPNFNPVRLYSPVPRFHYLFYVPVTPMEEDGDSKDSPEFDAPRLSQQIDKILEKCARNGFGNVHMPRLTNKVHIAIKNSVLTAKEKKFSTKGSLMIVKAFLGTQKELLGTQKDLLDTQTAETFLNSGHSAPKGCDYDSVYRVVEGEEGEKAEMGKGKGRIWHIRNNELVVPEYILRFHVQRTKKPALRSSSVSQDFRASKSQTATAEKAGRQFSRLRETFEGFLFRADLITRSFKSFQDKNEIQISSNSGSSSTRETRPQIELKEVSIDSMQRCVDLYNHGLLVVPPLPRGEVLTTLRLAYNQIMSIEDVFLTGSRYPALTSVDLSYNRIGSLEGIPKLPALKSFDFSGNLIENLGQISGSELPVLEEINFRGNPITQHPSYVIRVLSRFSGLQILDMTSVKDFFIRKVGPGFVNTESIIKCSNLWKSDSSYQAILGEHKEDHVMQKIQNLKFKDLGLETIELPSSLSDLTSLHLSGNHLMSINTLDLNRFPKLMSLDISRNCITAVSCLQFPIKLRKLSLGHNKISTLTDIGRLSLLTHLSLENNEINSLAPFQDLKNLIELYMSFNSVTRLGDIRYLQRLSRFMILDLTGNPIVEEKGYRLFCVFYLRKVKFIDGKVVKQSELLHATESFSGKLTDEQVRQRLEETSGISVPPSSKEPILEADSLIFKGTKSLSLMELGLKNIGILDKRFEGLRILDLSRNRISDVGHFHPLPNLCILRLNENRISSIPDADKTKGYLASCFPALEILELDSNRINSIQSLHLHGLSHLRLLSLDSNNIVNVDGLAGLTRLEHLQLSHNRIKQLDRKSMSNVSNLRGLNLDSNCLRSLAHIAPLTHLRTLSIAHNRISDLNEIEAINIRRFPTLSKLTIKHNPICRKQGFLMKVIRTCEHLLIIDGSVITPHDRMEAGQEQYAVLTHAHGSHGRIAGVHDEGLAGPGGYRRKSGTELTGVPFLAKVVLNTRSQKGQGRR